MNLIPRSINSSSNNDRPASPTNEQTSKSTTVESTKFFLYDFSLDANEKNESIEDSVLTVSDNGQAQFVAIDINTFAVQPRKSSIDSQ